MRDTAETLENLGKVQGDIFSINDIEDDEETGPVDLSPVTVTERRSGPHGLPGPVQGLPGMELDPWGLFRGLKGR